jgi:hypothetical protein
LDRLGVGVAVGDGAGKVERAVACRRAFAAGSGR